MNGLIADGIRPLTFLCKVCLLHSSQLEYVTPIFAMWNLITFPGDTNISWVFQTHCRKQKLKNYYFYTPKKNSQLKSTFLPYRVKIVISISRNGLLKACASFIIERSEMRKKQHAFKSVHFECRMVLFYILWEKSRL